MVEMLMLVLSSEGSMCSVCLLFLQVTSLAFPFSGAEVFVVT
jgi:hypothetical protein